MQAALIYPHQLFPNHPALAGSAAVFLVEDPLLFSHYRFHRCKLMLHRASMEVHADSLRRQGRHVQLIEAHSLPGGRGIGELLRQHAVTRVQCVDLCDDWMTQRLQASLDAVAIPLQILSDPHFLTPPAAFDRLNASGKKWFFTDFYIDQRKRLGILLDDAGKPVGGKWSFDPENRKKLPREIRIPPAWQPHATDSTAERNAVQSASAWAAQQFPGAPGHARDFNFPVSRPQALDALHTFLDQRLADFGLYEDAIHSDHVVLFHSLLTPPLNIGLLSPEEVVAAALQCSDHVPLNSLEGFIRQVIGWREYIRGVYLHFGRQQRCRNFWGWQHRLPAAFYDGTTGIEPVDLVIHRVVKHAWCHHIERLMILGNFMLLCELHPDDVYRWFMELFIDAYDWVMVPNVYGMSQYADGGLITTKPYISGSAYVLRMSNFRRGPWCDIWDALYWRFVDRHRDFFASNPRMSMMVRQCEQLGPKLTRHHRTAETFLERLHAGLRPT
ncbi:MAG: cryptochrome/photolyase family protein [Planctomycetota bacterium]